MHCFPSFWLSETPLSQLGGYKYCEQRSRSLTQEQPFLFGWEGKGKRGRDSQGSGAPTDSNQMAAAWSLGSQLHVNRLFGGLSAIRADAAMISCKWKWFSSFGAVTLPMLKVGSVRSLLGFRKYAIKVILRSSRTTFWVLNYFGFQNLNSKVCV